MQTILLHARRFKLSKLLKLSKDKTFGLSLLTAEDIWFKWDLPQRSVPPINLWKICIDLKALGLKICGFQYVCRVQKVMPHRSMGLSTHSRTTTTRK